MSLLPRPSEVVFSRGAWLPSVTVRHDRLHLDIAGGADAMHDPREFTIVCEERHLDALRGSLARQVLLYSALVPLCEQAGIDRPIDAEAAGALLDPILCGTDAEVDAFMQNARHSTDVLIAYGAVLSELARGRFVASLQQATETAKWARVREHRAERERLKRGVVLSRLDTAVLQFTGRLVHPSASPRRDLQAVKPALRAKVTELVAAAEQACLGMQVRSDPPQVPRGERPPSWDDRRAIREQVEEVLLRSYPHLAKDAAQALAALMAAEAPRQA